jgi:hypothetical protein
MLTLLTFPITYNVAYPSLTNTYLYTVNGTLTKVSFSSSLDSLESFCQPTPVGLQAVSTTCRQSHS